MMSHNDDIVVVDDNQYEYDDGDGDDR